MTANTETSSGRYVAIVGDLVASRHLPDRVSVQSRLRESIDGLNEATGHALAAPLKLTGGDEMKTIIRDPAVAVDVITRLSDDLHPMSLVWGVGRGEIETDWTGDVGALDGPCFHRARRAVEEASEEGVWARVHGFSALDDAVLSGLFRLVGAIRASWTETQINYIRSVRQRTQRETAERLGVTEGAISHSLRSARFQDVQEGEAVLRRLLAAYREAPSSPPRSSPDAPGASS